MPRRALGLSCSILLAACAAAAPKQRAVSHERSHNSAAQASDLPQRSRFVHGLPEAAFWVSHDSTLDRVVHGGVRFELAPDGRVLAAAWTSELINGSLALSESTGGGFLHWSSHALFRSSSFTGPLEPIQTPAGLGIDGLRPGFDGAIVFSNKGNYKLLPRDKALRPLAEPALVDMGAIDARRALRLDVFGRVSFTHDRGKSWIDLAPRLGASARSLTLGEGTAWIDTWQGRFTLDEKGELELDERLRRRSYRRNAALSYQIAFKDTRAERMEGWPYDWRNSTPLEAAVVSGAEVGDGTAFGVIMSNIVRVDLATGEPRASFPHSIPNGVNCEPLRAPDGVLFACLWEPYQGYGGFVMRSVDGEPPRMERAFSEDGFFVGDDDGALAYVGPCRAEPRLFDPDDPDRMDGFDNDKVQPVVCVRRGPGDWIERHVEVEPASKLLAWVPERSGKVSALVFSRAPLPEPDRGTPRTSEQAGVRVITLREEIPGYEWDRIVPQSRLRGRQNIVNKRFGARSDGTIDGWIARAGSYGSDALGVTLRSDGRPVPHTMPPDRKAMVATGDHGLALSDKSELFETVDHGRSWRKVGRSPVPHTAFSSSACSRLGCMLGPLVRLGWGPSELSPSVPSAEDDELASDDELQATENAPVSAPAPLLSCTPVGSPLPLASSQASRGSRKQTIGTRYGGNIEVFSEQSSEEPQAQRMAQNPWQNPPGLPPGGPAVPNSAPVVRTRSVAFVVPFEPLGRERRLDATNIELPEAHRATVTPVLGERGQIGLLLLGDQSDVLLGQDSATLLPSLETHRYYMNDAPRSAISLGKDRVLMLGELRHRLALEERSKGAASPRVIVGLDLEELRRRPMALGRREDGTVGILVLDGEPPATVGVGIVDRNAGIVSEIHSLAPLSSIVSADDPRCRADRDAFEAIVEMDPATWFAMDPRALAGVTLLHKGMAHVRWGKEQVCVLALDLSASEGGHRDNDARQWRLVARFGQRGEGNAAFRTDNLRQALRCSLSPPARGKP